MRGDPGSNYTIDEELAAKEYATGNHEGAGVDHSAGQSVAFFITAGTIGSSGTIDVKTQYSDDNSTWADYDDADDDGGNDTNATQITAAGDQLLEVPNPLARYTRCYATVGTAACSFGIVSILGPKKFVDPS